MAQLGSLPTLNMLNTLENNLKRNSHKDSLKNPAQFISNPTYAFLATNNSNKYFIYPYAYLFVWKPFVEG
jgi:hypothetical protein